MAKKAKKKAKKKSSSKVSKKASKKTGKKAAKKTKKKARRTTMYSSKGKKLYAVRSADGGGLPPSPTMPALLPLI